jgi:hypothetical protein
MTSPDTALQKCNVLMNLYKKNPYAVVDSEAIKIISSFYLDEEGNLLPTASGKDLIQTFRPNRCQKIRRWLHEQYRKEGRKMESLLLKSRSIGATTDIQAFFASSVSTRSGVSALSVAHKPKATQNIYKMGARMIRNMPEWMRPSLVYDSADLVQTEMEEWGVKDSMLKNVSSTNIDAIRSDRFLYVLYDECALYEDPEEVEQAVNSIVMATEEAATFFQTTGRGHEDFFYPRFMSGWQAQGNRNPWEDSSALFRHTSVAVFFPFYYDTKAKTLQLHPEITHEWLLSDLDDYEKMLYKENILPFWLKFGLADKEASRRALEQLYWRRCKIFSEYNHMPKMTPAGGTVNNYLSFKREEPATVDEAFVSTAGQLVIPDHVRQRIRQRDICEPIMRGEIDESGKFRSVSEGGRDKLWLWKRPEEIIDPALAVDPGVSMIPQEGRANNDFNWKVDFTWAVLVDRATGEQVGEYVSQDVSYNTMKELYRLCQWVRDGRGEDKLPFFICETQHGQNILNYFVDMGYPYRRMFVRVTEGKLGNPSTRKVGFHTSVQSKPNAVRYLVQRLVDGHRIIRSRRLADQLDYFIEVRDNVFQAQSKGRGGPSSKDDGIMAMAMEAYADETAVIPQPAEIRQLDKSSKRKSLFAFEVQAGDSVEETIKKRRQWQSQIFDAEMPLSEVDNLPKKSEIEKNRHTNFWRQRKSKWNTSSLPSQFPSQPPSES